MKRIAVLMATAFVDMIGFAMVFPLLPFYALRLNAEEWMIGWMIAVFSIAQLTAAPRWGRLSDRVGRRPAILAGLAMSAAAFVVFGLAVTMWMLFLSRLIQGIGAGTTGVLQAYIGDEIEPKNRAKALGWLSASTSAGVMIGPAIGSLAFQLGPAAPGLIAASMSLTAMLFAWKWLPEPIRRHHSIISIPDGQPVGDVTTEEKTTAPPEEIGTLVTRVLRSPGGEVPRLIWIYAIGMLGFMSITSVMALYMESDFGITEGTIGPFFVYVGALGVIMRALILGKLVDWLGETKVMRLGALLLALGIFLIPFPRSIIGFALVIGLMPIGTALLFPAVSALVTHRVRQRELGQTLGVQQAFGGTARVIAPIWATAVFQGLGVHYPFYIAAGVAGVVLLLTLRVRRKVLPPEPATTPSA